MYFNVFLVSFRLYIPTKERKDTSSYDVTRLSILLTKLLITRKTILRAFQNDIDISVKVMDVGKAK